MKKVFMNICILLALTACKKEGEVSSENITSDSSKTGDYEFVGGYGAKTYKLVIPTPAKLFWSVTIYDAETRSQVATDQNKAALRSLF